MPSTLLPKSGHSAIFLAACALLLALAPAAQAEDMCEEFRGKDAAESIENINDETKVARDMLAATRTALEKDLLVFTYLAVPISAENAVAWALAELAEDDSPEAFEKFEQRLQEIVKKIIENRKRHRSVADQLLQRLQTLRQCGLLFNDEAIAARHDALDSLQLMEVRVEPNEDLKSSLENPATTAIITKSEKSVQYTFVRTNNKGEKVADQSFSYALSGVPSSLRKGSEFTIKLTGKASGWTSTAGGSCNGALVRFKSGLKTAETGSTGSALVGIPQKGQQAQKECHRNSSTQEIPVIVTGKDQAIMEFRVGHQSGSKLVSTFVWKSAR